MEGVGKHAGRLLVSTAVAGVTATAPSSAGAAKQAYPPEIAYPAHGEVGSGLDGYHALGDVVEVSFGNPRAADVYIEGERYRP